MGKKNQKRGTPILTRFLLRHYASRPFKIKQTKKALKSADGMQLPPFFLLLLANYLVERSLAFKITQFRDSESPNKHLMLAHGCATCGASYQGWWGLLFYRHGPSRKLGARNAVCSPLFFFLLSQARETPRRAFVTA
ncbi:hypothetical protein CDAR_35321 [Caerostris darwini]|uniref:Uncharacterized protein n=1 Tax=Caerostris darwini TaxID=1538125 RepID=A0AAV4SRX4_9ARAC|nr:hypothetical protein CDAR_35321 [Caerostris darwini]